MNRFIGTSSGAILAFSLGFGYELNTLVNILKGLNTEKMFKTNSQMFLYLFDELGLYDTENVKKLFDSMIKQKGYSKNITFEEFYSKTKIDLCFTTYCLNTKKLMLLNYIFTPTLEISRAITMSIAIPIIIKPVTYMNQNYIDPCLICNFPIDFVKTEDFLGFVVSSKKKYEDKITFLSLLKNIYSSIYDEFLNIKVVMSYKNNDRIFILPCDTSTKTTFDISSKEIDALITDGYNNFKILFEEKS